MAKDDIQKGGLPGPGKEYMGEHAHGPKGQFATPKTYNRTKWAKNADQIHAHYHSGPHQHPKNPKMLKSLDAAIDMLEKEFHTGIPFKDTRKNPIADSKAHKQAKVPGLPVSKGDKIKFNDARVLSGKTISQAKVKSLNKALDEAIEKAELEITKSSKTKNPPKPATKLPKPTNYVIPKKINPAKARAKLIIQKSIEMLEKELDPRGFTPISDESLMKAFDGKIPDVFKATENRPSKSWLDSCLAKAEASEDDPKGYCMRLWVGEDEKPEDDKDLEKAVKDAKMACDGDKKEDIDEDLKKAITGCEAAGIPQAQLAEVISKAFLTKAVAEPIGSKFSPKARKPTSDNGGESEISGHPSDADPSDLEPNAKEETK